MTALAIAKKANAMPDAGDQQRFVAFLESQQRTLYKVAYIYCRETSHTTAQFHARMFAPDLANEDPATGSAAAAFAAVVHRFDDIKDGTRRLGIEQGYEMGRPSRIELEIMVAGGQLRLVRIGGRAVRVSSGTIEV